MDFFKNIDLILIQAPVILFSLTVHEYFHAYTANRLGDPTAEERGRLTLNPIAHLDIFGTVLMFFVGFGWAKPVPINPMNFKEPKKGTLLVAIAGPISNLATAIVAGLLLQTLIPEIVSGNLSQEGVYGIVTIILILMLVYGIVLAVFNMIPVPPLDGSRVVYALLPDSQAQVYGRFEPYGVMFLFALFIFGGGIFKYMFYPVSLLTEMLSGYSYGTLWSIVELIMR